MLTNARSRKFLVGLGLLLFVVVWLWFLRYGRRTRIVMVRPWHSAPASSDAARNGVERHFVYTDFSRWNMNFRRFSRCDILYEFETEVRPVLDSHDGS